MGEEGKMIMYRFVEKSECERYRRKCSEILTRVRDALSEDKDIVTRFTLVGSGAKNLVTRNGNGPFDLDYNLEIIRAPYEYLNDLRRLKETVRVFLDDASGKERFSESQNSTVALTALMHSDDKPQVKFSFDVAIVKKNENGTLCRLKYNKHYYINGVQGQYFWNEIPSSRDVGKKADRIKKAGKWNDVRKKYIDLKNHYLSLQDDDHPSFIVYIEAVNQIFDQYFKINYIC